MAEAGSSPASSKVFFDLAGLADAWDMSKQLRNRMKEVGALLVEKPPPDGKECLPEGIVGRSTDNAKYNEEVLTPVFTKMAGQHDKVPELNGLVNEVKSSLLSHGWHPSRKSLMDQAWSIRYGFGVVKNLLYKPAPPRVACSHFITIVVSRLCLNLFLGVKKPVKKMQDPVLLKMLRAYGVDCEAWKPAKEVAEVRSAPAPPSTPAPAEPTPPAAPELPPVAVKGGSKDEDTLMLLALRKRVLEEQFLGSVGWQFFKVSGPRKLLIF